MIADRGGSGPGHDSSPAGSPAAELYSRHLAALSRGLRTLPDKPDETPLGTLHALWLAAAGAPGTVIDEAEDLPELSDAAGARLDEMVERRLSGVPLAHLVGWQRFLGLRLRADARAMIPRLETELLAAVALEELRRVVGARGRARAIDACTGSGNIALALAHYVPECEVLGADLSADAVELARENARLLGLDGRVRFRQGDLLEPFLADAAEPAVDLITCNPPYVTSARVPLMAAEISSFEPREAFDGGRFGMDVLLRLISGAPRLLSPGAALCVEVGAGQGEFIAGRMERSGAYSEVTRCRDGQGEIRVLLARAGPL